MKIPKFVVELMGRAEFDLQHPQGVPGYTIRVFKATDYTRHETLCKEVERLVAWANKVAPVPAFLAPFHRRAGGFFLRERGLLLQNGKTADIMTPKTKDAPTLEERRPNQ